MKNEIKCFLVFIFFLFTTLYSQDYPDIQYSPEEKAKAIASIDTNDIQFKYTYAIHLAYVPIRELMPRLEEIIRDQKHDIAFLYLQSLSILNSDKVVELSHWLINELDHPDYCCGYEDPLYLKANITGFLFKAGDYSTTQIIFDFIEENKPRVMPDAYHLLEDIINNVSEYEEQAKEELIRIATSMNETQYSYPALSVLVRHFPEESIPILENVFMNHVDGSNQRFAYEKLYELGDPNLEELIKQKLYSRNHDLDWELARFLLYEFGTPEDYKYVSEFVNQIKDSSSAWSLNFSLEQYKVPEPEGFVTVETMLGTLLSYTDKCYEYEWITSKGTYNSLSKKLNNAKKELEKGNEDKVKKELIAFQSEVYKQNGKHITEDGYKFLYYYPEYIIGQFPAGENLMIDSMSPTITVTKTKEFTLTVYGINFSKKSDVYFNGEKIKTKFISKNELEAEVKDKDIKKEGSYAVYVSEKEIGRTEELEFNVYKELPGKLIPVLNCIEDLEGKKSLAWFGYENYNEGTVLIEGKENEIKGGKKKDKEVPPVIFLPGVHEKVFSVEFDDKKNLKWELLKEKAEVTADTPPCQ